MFRVFVFSWLAIWCAWPSGRSVGLAASRRIEYNELPPALRARLAAIGITEQAFPSNVERVHTENERRVAAGEREHLIYYALQSASFTRRPRIEPAVSARAFIDRLPHADRERLLDDAAFLPAGGWPPAERARVADLLAALHSDRTDARLAALREIAGRGAAAQTPDTFYPDYVRVARFLYRKEFVAAGASQVGRLYQARAHSSDTALEAGFGVYLGLGTLGALESSARLNEVLIVGPGLDLAPRTDLVDVVAPQSYQPFAVADALLALSLSAESTLHVRSVDINPRVVQFLQAVVHEPPTLHLFTGVAESVDQPFSEDYRSYVRQLGRAIGESVAAPRAIGGDRRYHHSIAVRAPIARAMSAERLDIVTERLTERAPFDLAVVTNVFAYFDDRQLALALANIGAMLRPGGYLLHNESRAGLAETATAANLPVLHMRSAVIGGSRTQPLYDTVWLHRRTIDR